MSKSERSEYDDIEFLTPQKKNFFITPLATKHEYYLSGPIVEAEHYIEWFEQIRRANPNDDISIYINSTGGNLDTALQFMRVMSESAAHITCSIEGSCMSAATIIFLQADAFEITPHSLFMLHNYSGGIAGKGGEMYDQAIFERKWSTSLFQSVYKDFLEQKEIDMLLDSKDIWFTSEEVAERCKRVLEARQREMVEDGESISDTE